MGAIHRRHMITTDASMTGWGAVFEGRPASGEWKEELIWDDGVKSGAEVYKQDPHVSPWSVQLLQDEGQSHVDCIIHRPVFSVGKLQGFQQGSSGVFHVSQNQSFNDYVISNNVHSLYVTKSLTVFLLKHFTW